MTDKKNHMGGQCSTYGGGEAYKGFGWRNLMEREHLEAVDGKKILR